MDLVHFGPNAHAETSPSPDHPISPYRADLAQPQQFDRENISSKECASMGLSRSSGPKADEWDLYRPKIETLYREQGLKGLALVMKRDHGFTASDRMYKTRIHKWKIDKNVKAKEMKAIVRKQAQRSFAGKTSAFRLRDVVVPEHKIVRFRKTARLLSEEQALKLRATTPPGLVCFTPLCSPLSTPAVLVISEKAAKLMQEYFLGSFESKFWNRTHSQILTDAINLFQRTLALAFDLGSEHQDKHAWQLLEVATACMEPLLKADDPFTLKVIISGLLHCCIRHGRHSFLPPVLKHLSEISTTVKTENHPASRIFRSLLDLDSPQLKHVFGVIQQAQSDTFAQHLGPLHWSTLHSRLWDLWCMDKEVSDPIRASWNLLQEIEHTLGQVNEQCLELRRGLAWEYYQQSEYHSAAQTAQSLLDLLMQSPEVHQYLQSRVLNILAWAQFKLSEPHLAVQNLRRSTDLWPIEFGYESTVASLNDLDHMLSQLGRTYEAAEVRRQINEIIESRYRRHKMEEEERWAKYQADQALHHRQPSALV
ncbi:MAG: hypothetical protein Q9171_003168 [Xanthocarpia ochracea]